MIYFGTKKRIERLTPEERIEVARLFGVEVEDLKRISPWKWDYAKENEKFWEIRYAVLGREYSENEKFEEKLKSGEIAYKVCRNIKYKYKKWSEDGYSRIYEYTRKVGNRDPWLKELGWVIANKKETSEYDSFLQVEATKYKPKAKVYQYQNRIYIVQRYFAINYKDLYHMAYRGLLRYAPESFLRQDDISGETKFHYGTKEWVKDRIPKEELIKYNGLEFIFFLDIYYPQTSKRIILSRQDSLPKLGPFEIDQDE